MPLAPRVQRCGFGFSSGKIQQEEHPGFPETSSVLSRVKSRYCDLGVEHKRDGEEEINENHYQL